MMPAASSSSRRAQGRDLHRKLMAATAAIFSNEAFIGGAGKWAWVLKCFAGGQLLADSRVRRDWDLPMLKLEQRSVAIRATSALRSCVINETAMRREVSKQLSVRLRGCWLMSG